MLIVEQSQWVPSFSNDRFGRVEVVQMMKEDSKTPAYQGLLFSESRGEVDVVVNDEGKIAFVINERHAVLDPKLYADNWGKTPVNYFSYAKEKRGMALLELPRGLNTKLMGEANEEIEYEVASAMIIGNVNMNTAVNVTSPFVAVTRAVRYKKNLGQHDPNERVKEVVWLTPEETRSIYTLDGFTHAALHMVRTWALRQKSPMGSNPDPFWSSLRERL